MAELSIKSKCNDQYVVTPKIEVLGELDITYKVDDKKHVLIKEELPNSGIHPDRNLNGHGEDMDRPIKTEPILSDDLKQSKLSEFRNISDMDVCPGNNKVVDVKQEQLFVANVHAACPSTNVPPLPTHPSSNVNKEQAEEAKIQISVEMHKGKDLHNKPAQKPFSCQLCNYKCIDKKSLVRHERIHSGHKPYTCHFCNYKCNTNGSLVIHLRIHSGQKPYSCKYCDYKCISNNYLVRHERTHTGQKPFSCELCNYKCALKSHLVRHTRTHTGEKPHCCQLCEYKCLTNSHLVRHMKIHTR